MDKRSKTDNIKCIFFSVKKNETMNEWVYTSCDRYITVASSIARALTLLIIVMEIDVQTRWCWVHIIDLFRIFYMSIRQIHACIIHSLASGTASQSVIMLLVWSFSPLTNKTAACYYVTAMFMCPIRAACVRSGAEPFITWL